MANGDLQFGGTGIDLSGGGINPLTLSPDLGDVLARDRLYYHGGVNPLLPSYASSPMPSPIAVASAARNVSPTNFDLAFGDSIAVQQMRNRRIWGGEGPQYNAASPAPFDLWHTAAVGDPPSRILDRAKYLLEQNPDYFRGKTIFSPIGSNDPSQMDSVKQYLQLLKDNGAKDVVVPGMGPGVRDSAAANKALQGVVEGAGFTYFAPQINWARDGVHPSNSQQMFDQANQALGRVRPASSSSVPSQPGLQPQPGAANALSPQAAAYTPYTGPHSDIYNMSLYHGVNPELGMVAARIESNFGQVPDRAGSQYKGVYQMGDQEWKAVGGTDANRGDRGMQVNLGIASLANRQQELANTIGRTPANWEIYMAHQQGSAGVAALMANPSANASEALASAGGMTRDEAAQRIRANGGNPDGTAGDFLKLWKAKYDHFKNEVNAPPFETAQVVPGHYGYQSGQRVPGTPYAVGGRVAGMVPQPTQGTELPEVGVSGHALSPEVKAVADPISKFVDLERKVRLLQMASIAGGMFKGRQFVPVDYDPFKVAEAGAPRVPDYSYGIGSSSTGLGAGIGPRYGR